MKRALLLVLAVSLSGGCFVGKVYKKAFAPAGKVFGAAGKVYAKVLPDLPEGDPNSSGPPADASRLLAGPDPFARPAALMQTPVADEEPQDDPAPVVRRSTSTNTTITHTVQRAPTYPSEPFIAMWPASRGSSARVCRVFTAHAENKAQCMAECRAKSLGEPGSCTCMDGDRCPDGVRVAR